MWINLSFINCFYRKQHCHFNGEMYLFLVPKEHRISELVIISHYMYHYHSVIAIIITVLLLSLSQCYCSDYYNYDIVIIMITSINGFVLLVSKQSLD